MKFSMPKIKLPNSGDIIKGAGQAVGAYYDPLNISGYGGIPGINSNGRSLEQLAKDVGGDIKNVVGDITGTNAMNDALAAQTAGAAQATNSVTTAYNQQRKDLQPWQQGGMAGLSGLQNRDMLQNFQGDPGYQFRLNEGNKAINAAAAARGMGNSGATMKALTRYGQDFASNEYNNAYNREFGRLSTLANIGGNAAIQQSNAAGQYGSNLAGIQTGLANANASARIAQQNGMNNLLGAGITGGAMVLASDERLKADIMPINPEDLKEMKKHLKAYFFKYKDQILGKGEWSGVMAQDLEKSKLGRTLIEEDENGFKFINLKKLASLFLATLAEA